MPKIEINGATIHYEKRGNGQETVIFSHGFLFNSRMFEHQIAALEDRYTCIAYDHRGQGQSERTASGYEIDNVSEDARALIEALDCAPCHFVGLSMGGFVGLRLAIRYPYLLQSLVLIETSADVEPKEKISRYKLLGLVGRWLGFRLVIGQVLPIMFGQKFLNDPAREKERNEWKNFMISFDRPTLPKVLDGVTGRRSVFQQIDQIMTPTLIIVGDQDAVYPPEIAERMQKKIPNSDLVIVPDAGHTSSVEEPFAVTAAIESFLIEA